MNVNIWDIDIKAVEKLDPQASAMLQSAVSAARDIFMRRKALDAAGLEKQALFVVAGENHWRPAQRLHHILLLEALKHSGETMSVAYEYPATYANEDDVYDFLRDVKGMNNAEIAEYIDFYLYNPIGKGMCDMYVNMCSSSLESPYAMQTLSHYLFTQHTENMASFIALNSDAARTPKGESLSLTDAFTKACIKECLGEAKSGISVTSSKGMWVRNLHMAHKLYQAAEVQDARIAVQLCGQTHVNGDGKNNKAQYSLRGIFNLWAMPVHALFFDAEDAELNGLDKEEYSNAINLANEEAYYDPSLKKAEQDYAGFGTELPDIQTQRKEKKFVENKLDNMGLSHLKIQ